MSNSIFGGPDPDKTTAPPTTSGAPSQPLLSTDDIRGTQHRQILVELQAIRKELQSIRKASRLTVMDGMSVALGFLLMGVLAWIVTALFGLAFFGGLLRTLSGH